MIIIPEAEKLRGKISRKAATLGMAVEDYLREEIVTGRIAPSEPLRETALSEKLKISTTPIRDALSNLAQQALVKISTNRSKQAMPLDDRLFLDTILCRKLLLDAAVASIVFGKNAELVGQLHFQIGALVAALRDRKSLDALRAMLSFERVLITASENMEIKRVSETRSHYLARHIYLRLPSAIGPHLIEALHQMLQHCTEKQMPDAAHDNRNIWSPFIDAGREALR